MPAIAIHNPRPSQNEGFVGDIQVVVVNGHAHLVPGMPELTIDFVTTRCLPAPDGSGRLVPQVVPLYGSMEISTAGLEWALIGAAVQAGYRPTRVDHTPYRHLPAPATEALANFGTYDPEWLQFVRRSRGLLQYAPGGIDLGWLITQTALAYPQAKIAIVVKSKQAASATIRQIRRWLPAGQEIGYADDKRSPVQDCQVLVTTLFGLGTDFVDATKIDIALFLPATTALENRAVFPLTGPRGLVRARVLGLLPDTARLSDFDQDQLTTVFGFRTLVLPGHGCEFRPVATAAIRIPGPSVQAWTQPADVFRRGIVQHRLRNLRIAQLAMALLNEDEDVLVRKFPAIASAVRGQTCPCVQVVAANVDQAAALAFKLPGWPVHLGINANLHGLPGAVRRMLQSLQAGYSLSRGSIVTLAAMQDYAVSVPADVLIWAASGDRLPAIPDSQLVMCSGTAGGGPDTPPFVAREQGNALGLDRVPIDGQRFEFRHFDNTESATADGGQRLARLTGHRTIKLTLGHNTILSAK